MLHLHRSARADHLISPLGDLLATPLDDPFAPEVISVPSRGMERWLTQRLSHRLGASPGRGDGICALVDFPFPRVLVRAAVAEASGIDPDTDPWLPERAVWPLLGLIDALIEEPWLAHLATHLKAQNVGDPTHRARRMTTAQHLARLFDAYAVHRPGMVRAWAANQDVDAQGNPLASDYAWQAELWRRLRAGLHTPDPAHRTEAACQRLRDEPDLLALPPRLSLFGLTRLPPAHLEVLRALAAHREVHLFTLHPSDTLWERVAELDAPQSPSRADDPTATLARNRLLASWGRDSREMQLVLGGEGADHHHPVEDLAPATLLRRIQADIRSDRAPPGETERPPLDPADDSLQVHSCHGRARQVEVLRDAILHALADDPTLEPRDVIVMCPDVEAFAPLVQATFGAGQVVAEEDDVALPEIHAPDLRVRLADRAVRQTNPLLGVVSRLLELAGARVTASEVLDLAGREPVRRRFDLDDDDLARFDEWVADAGIRWGLDASHRSSFQLGDIEAGTWRAGLDRLLAGVAMTEESRALVAEKVLPLDDVESGAIELAGRLAELVERLERALQTFATPQPIQAWANALLAAADALTATGPREAWQRAELDRLVADASDEAGEHQVSLTVAELRSLLAERLQGRPTRANFRTGHLTVCTLTPMRSVPHRVVCLLGLDDGAFPRHAPRDGDDLRLTEPHVGDRDPRSEDRQLLLDALLAAEERLIVTYAGRDERTNVARPPAVPIGELLDVVDRTVRVDGDARPRDRIVIQHPLQPFDPRSFAPGALVPDGPWGFEDVMLRGASALLAPRAQPSPFLGAPLLETRDELVDLDDLRNFVERPIRAFLRQRLGVSVAERSDEVDDALPVALEPLDRWSVGQRLVEALLAGADGHAAIRAEIARGALPPGHLAQPVVVDIWREAEPIAATARAAAGDEAESDSLDVRVALPDGRTLAGTVAGLRGDLLLSVAYSRVDPRHRLAAWVRLLALTAAHPERAFTAATIGRARTGSPRGRTVTVARIGSLGGDSEGRRRSAIEQLAVLVDLRDRGMREPLPLACRTSAAYVEDGLGAARKAWESGYRHAGEDAEPEHRLVFGDAVPFDEPLAAAPHPGEAWAAEEATRFGQLALRLWTGLLAVEELEHR